MSQIAFCLCNFNSVFINSIPFIQFLFKCFQKRIYKLYRFYITEFETGFWQPWSHIDFTSVTRRYNFIQSMYRHTVRFYTNNLWLYFIEVVYMHTVRFYANYYQHNSIQYVLYMQQNFMPLTNSIISFILQILLQYMYVYIYIYIYIYI